jgi:hypothetical protein
VTGWLRRRSPRPDDVSAYYALLHVVAFALAFVSAAASVGLSFVLVCFFALPRASSRVRRAWS